MICQVKHVKKFTRRHVVVYVSTGLEAQHCNKKIRFKLYANNRLVVLIYQKIGNNMDGFYI